MIYLDKKKAVIFVVILVLYFIWSYQAFTSPDPNKNHRQDRRKPLFEKNSVDSDLFDDDTLQNPYLQALLLRLNSTLSPNDTYFMHRNNATAVKTFGKIQGGKNYSIFSSTAHNEESLNYLFDLPLAALAWHRIGFRSIVILVMDQTKMASNAKLKFVFSKLFDLEAFVIVLDVHSNFAVMLSQVSRLFVPYIINTIAIDNFTLWEDTYLVTTDADLWPLSQDPFLLPKDKEILSLNSHCCGVFTHKNRDYQMLPMGSIGMKVKMWKIVTRRRGFVPLDVEGIIHYLTREFGSIAKFSAIEKGENSGWFMDQQMISILIQDWSERENSSDLVAYVDRNIGRDRIDRNSWHPITLSGKVDAHVLESSYRPEIWNRLEALLVLMYDKTYFVWCQNYAKMFLALT